MELVRGELVLTKHQTPPHHYQVQNPQKKLFFLESSLNKEQNSIFYCSYWEVPNGNGLQKAMKSYLRIRMQVCRRREKVIAAREMR